MKRYFIIVFLFFIRITNAQNEFQSFINHVNSLSDSLEKAAAIDSFIVYARTKGIPFIENDSANFIYRGNVNINFVAGDFNDWSFTNMANLSGTDFFYYSRTFELNARIDYKFVLNGTDWILDPENPHQVLGGFGSNSELAMPEYVQPWEINYQSNILHGNIEETNFFSSTLDTTFEVQIYLPPSYNRSNQSYPSAYFQDGTDYTDFGYTINVLDNLLDSNKIQPIIGIFVKPNNRDQEYAFTRRYEYVQFFIDELIPFIDSSYKTISDPAQRLVLGPSFGGNISGLISYNHPEVFGNCGLQSAAFFPNNYEVFNLFVNNPKKDIKIHSIWGTYESFFPNLRVFRDSLINKNYEFEWGEFPEGHSWGLWRANLDNMLIYFFPSQPAGVVNDNKNIPQGFNLAQNYPNPFNPSTTIQFQVPNSSFVNLKVYDILGREVATLLNEEKPAGIYEVEFSASGLSSGIYFYKLQAGTFIETRQVVLMK